MENSPDAGVYKEHAIKTRWILPLAAPAVLWFGDGWWQGESME